MTRVIRFHEQGEPDVLRIDHIEVAGPAADEVQIAVNAIGLNRGGDVPPARISSIGRVSVAAGP